MIRFIVFAAFLCFFAKQSAAVTSVVDAGTTINGGNVPAVVTQNVYGTVNDMIVYGTQNIMSGGNSFNSTIYTYAQQTVNAGGQSENSVIMQNAVQKVYGTANFSTVNAYGSMSVYAGSANTTTVNGGTLYIRNGAEANNTILNTGRQYVYGTDNGTQIYNGMQIVTNGGTANDTTIHAGGIQQVDDGSAAVGTYIDGGRQNVYGRVENSVLAGGRQIIYSDASAAAPVVKGGELEINDMAAATNLTIDGGAAFVYGNASLSGQTTVKNGDLNLYSAISLPDLLLDKGNVNVKISSAEIPIDNLNGTGTFRLTTTVSEHVADVLKVGNGSGTYGIAFYDYSASEDFPGTLTLINTDNADQNFYLIGGAADIGAYRYDLTHIGDTWQLRKTPYLNDGSIVAKNTFAAVSAIFYAHLHSLGRRLEEVRFTKKTGLWIRGTGREIRLNFKDDTKSRLNVRGTQIGFDLPIEQDYFKEWIAGIYWGYSKSEQKFNNPGKGHSDTNSVGFYTSATTQNDYTFNLEGVFYHHKQKIDSYLANGFKVGSKYNLNAWSFSGAAGRRFSKNGWFVKPQLQAYYVRLPDISYRTDMNTPVFGKNADSIMGRAGVMGGKNFRETNQAPLEVYLKAAVLREFNKKSTVRFAGYDFIEDMTDTIYETGAGLSAEISKKFAVFLDFSCFFGSKADIPVDLSFGGQLFW